MRKAVKFLSAALLAGFCTVACEESGVDIDDSGNDITAQNDKQFQAIADRFVDHTVIPTYRALSDATEELVEKLQAFQASRTESSLNAACEVFLGARAYWEKSEAFLFGAATDFGIDPHIDSWPLDLEGLQTALKNTEQINAMAGEDGDIYAGAKLGNELLGFHGIEYIIFKDGGAKPVAEISDLDLIYAIAVAGDLRNSCFRMELSWAGEENTAEGRVAKVADELEVPYTVNGGASYGENMRNAGKAGSSYPSLTNAMEAIIDGCKTIADEVGTSKIGKPHNGEDPNYIESPYSHKSITDFYDNMISIKNVYYGGTEGNYKEDASLHGYIKEHNAELDAKIVAAIENALAKINAMKAPFVTNYTDASAGEAIEACQELDSILSLAKEEVRK